MMVTKEGKTDFKDKQNTFINGNNQDNQYSNLNLNGNYTCSSISSVQSDSKTTTSGKNCDDFYTDKNEGSNYVSTYMKASNGLEQVQEMFERRKANDQNDIPEKDSLNNSTLSLHIAAYENSAEASALTKECNEEKEGSNNGKSGLYKKAKQIVAGPVSAVQNPFEFPRQQKNQTGEPAIMQFKASQRLLNPNESKAESQQKRKPFSFDSSADSDEEHDEDDFRPASNMFLEDSDSDESYHDASSDLQDVVPVFDRAEHAVSSTVRHNSESLDTNVSHTLDDNGQKDVNKNTKKNAFVSLNSSEEVHISENENNGEAERSDEPPPKKKRGPRAEYEEFETVESVDEVKLKAKNAGMKLHDGKNNLYFDCKMDGCPYKWKAKRNNNLDYVLSATTTEHNHDVQLDRQNGLTEAQKKIVDKRLINREPTNAGACLTAFSNEGMTSLPTNLQVRNYVAYRKSQVYPDGCDMSYDDMAKLVKDLGSEPEIVDFQYELDPQDPTKSQFALSISCKSLMDEMRGQKHGQVDGTYKLVTDNFVVIPFGYSDKNRHFHPTGVSIVSSESTKTYTWIMQFLKSNRFYEEEWSPTEFLSDNSRAITAAIHRVFPDAQRKNCFAHVMMQVERKLSEMGIDDATGTQIKQDICQIACASSKEHFELLSEYYLNAWEDTANATVIEFSSYFRKQYVERDKNWYASNGAGIRSNNGIEGSNKWIKVDFITRRAPLSKAIHLLKKWVLKARDKNYGSPQIVVTGAELVKAFELKKKTKITYNENNGYYCLRKSESSLSDRAFFTLLEKVYGDNATVEDVLEFQMNVAIVTASIIYENVWTCNCFVGCKRQYCKHIIVVAVRNGEYTFDNIEAQRQKLTSAARNPPGRPKKYKKALQRD